MVPEKKTSSATFALFTGCREAKEWHFSFRLRQGTMLADYFQRRRTDPAGVVKGKGVPGGDHDIADARRYLRLDVTEQPGAYRLLTGESPDAFAKPYPPGRDEQLALRIREAGLKVKMNHAGLARSVADPGNE